MTTWADITLRELEDGRFEIIKGEDCGTIVQPINLNKVKVQEEFKGNPYDNWEC